jgi:hypothetical protein
MKLSRSSKRELGTSHGCGQVLGSCGLIFCSLDHSAIEDDEVFDCSNTESSSPPGDLGTDQPLLQYTRHRRLRSVEGFNDAMCLPFMHPISCYSATSFLRRSFEHSAASQTSSFSTV